MKAETHLMNTILSLIRTTAPGSRAKAAKLSTTASHSFTFEGEERKVLKTNHAIFSFISLNL
jgi:hypothetical protein